MYRGLVCICLSALLFAAWPALADEGEAPQRKVGTLSCKILPDSGINLLIHSTRDVLCEFTPDDGGTREKYKGETGIEFGIDASFNKRTDIAYSVLANHVTRGSRQLAGKYTGAGGGITLGVSVGDSAPLRKNDGTISLQPIQVNNTGSGVAAGFTYLYLEGATK
ncbi:MAG TPA: DUF992 domain-containing protein [Mariprofundaceae bacterium]|nr:DUF992 domain-containing protein [Mariprofundaceae bacterium]